MIQIQIPGSKDLMIEHVLLDFNGTIGVGNGANDEQMLQEAILGVAALGTEGLATRTLAASDLLVPDILDLFTYFETPNRLVACLRK